MKVEEIKASRYHKKRSNTQSYEKTGKITIITTDKAELTLEQEAKIIKFLETL
jgi:hypothetical protein